MQELKQALEELKDLHQKVLDRPAPEFGPQSYIPFPAGVDPLQHALFEAQQIKQMAEQVTFAPRPGAWLPPADSFVTKDEFVVWLETPGISREDLKVFVVGGECVVRGERKPPQCAAAMRPTALERPWGRFERRFVVPVGSRLDEMKARMFDGLLEIRIPMKVAEAPKEQKVEVS